MASAQAATVSGQKFKAIQATLQENEALWPALLVFLGALFMLNLFYFYPLWLTFILAALCGALAYYMPDKPFIGTILGVILAFPAIAYQAPIFAWLFTLIVSLTLFKAFNDWYLISFLEIVVCAPFAPPPLIFLGGFVQFALTLGALYGGSKRSIFLSLPAVFLILLLTTLWLAPNSAFMLTKPLELNYGPALSVGDQLVLSRDRLLIPDIKNLVTDGINAMGNLITADTIRMVNPALMKVINNSFNLLVNDAALLQLAAWAGALFLIGYIPGVVRGVHRQLMAGAVIIIIPLSHYFIANLYGIQFPNEIIFYTAVTLILLYLMEAGHLNIARENIERHKDKTRKFGHLGVEDLSTSEGGPESLDAVGGYDSVKRELRDAILTPMQNKELAVTYGIKPPNGILLFGPPGTGKTFLMKALSRELNVGFYYVKCSDLTSKWVGETEKNIAELFATARKNAPCLLFFDEIDSIARSRAGLSEENASSYTALTQLLLEMDSVPTTGPHHVIVMGATNAPNKLDPAIMRPGRFDKLIYMPLPDAPAREAILKLHSRSVPLAEDVDFKKLAAMTDRYSGADLANVAREAIHQTAREAQAANQVIPLSMKHFLAVLKYLKASTHIADLDMYEKFRIDFERRVEEEAPQVNAAEVKWDDVVGLSDVRRALNEAVELPLLHPELMAEYHLKPIRGLLLFGPPGCGKTMIVRAASHQLNATFLTLSGADLMKAGSQSALDIMRETFNRAREQPPALIFFDEIESLAASRSTSSSLILTQLLQEMDGLKEMQNVVVIGATNRPSMMDAALLRPGRFDKILYIPPPDTPGREQILHKALGSLLPDLDYAKLAAVTAGFSGADLVSVSQEVKTRLVRQRIAKQKAALSTSEVLQILGDRRPSITNNELMEHARFMQEFGERR